VSNEYDLTGVHGAEVFRTLPEGLKIELTNGAVGEITANPHNGAVLLVTYVEYPDNPAKVGEEEAVFFTSVKRVVT
jgi:hypothetical protein